MTTAAEMAKQKLGLNNPAGNNQTAEEQSIDTVMKELDEGELTEAKRTSLRLRVAEMKQRIRDLENKATGNNGSGSPTVTEAKSEAVTSLKREIAENAKAFLDSGLPPDTVAKYLQNSLTNMPNTVGIGGPLGASDLASLITAIGNLIKPNGNGGGDPEIKEVLNRLAAAEASRQDDKFDKLVEQQNKILEELKGIKSGGGEEKTKRSKVLVINNGKVEGEFEPDSPIIVKEPSGGGRNIEEIKEDNRHNERLEELKETKEYHKGLVETLGDTAERVGEGLAQNAERQVSDNPPPAKANKKPRGVLIKCPYCEESIPIYPETPNPFPCPKCGEKVGFNVEQ